MTGNVVWHAGQVGRDERARITGGDGATVWLTGLPGSGKSTIAHALERALVDFRRACYVLDGDNIRHGLNHDLGFSKEDRRENVRRLGEVARLMADAGLVSIVPAISPYAADRQEVRAIHEAVGVSFIEVFVDTPAEVCESRDPKGMYALARAGRIQGFTGVDDPYEAPEHPEMRIETTRTPANQAAGALVDLISNPN